MDQPTCRAPLSVSPSAAEVLAAQGLLASAITDFSPRLVQQTMAAAIEKTLSAATTLIVEAGTGTGKTFAYLVPAILAQQKIIISTGTKNLQDQLFNRDLPLVRQVLGVPLKVALLKGRANYLCQHRLNNYYQDGRFSSKSLVTELHLVKNWANTTKSGDIAELANVPEDSAIWHYATSTADNCLGQECDFYNDCFLVKARRIAQEADILVINHHLFFADAALRDTGFGELLPGSQAVIFDEAHQLAETASNFLGESLSSRQLLLLTRDIIAAQLKTASDAINMSEAAKALQLSVQQMRLAFGLQEQKNAWSQIAYKPELKAAIEIVQQNLNQLAEILKPAAARSKDLENCWQRTLELIPKFSLLTTVTADEYIHWYQTYPQSFVINLTPMKIADHFQKILAAQNRAWIFTSATLTVGHSFQHFSDNLGLTNTPALKLESPFDYANQSLLYIPVGLPDPSQQNYVAAMLEMAIPVINACQGRTFILFTSYRALKEAANILESAIKFPLLVQGTMSKAKLLQQYCELGNAVLLGTNSFWEGVDVRGEALSCVIIDKLPFATPDDPVLKARVNALKKQGQDPFYQYQLPHAVMALKQGAGRLIRDFKDRGVLMLCDPRLIDRPYGKTFRDSLPPMPLTRELQIACDFFTKKPLS